MQPENERTPRPGSQGADISATTPNTPTIPRRADVDVDPLRVIAAALVDIAATLTRIETHDDLRWQEECRRRDSGRRW